MQSTRETRRPCKRAHECTHKHIPALPLPLHPPRSQTLPTLNTTTQSPHNSNPQSSLSINSRVALQHVRFQPDKSFHASQVTSLRCNEQGRHAVSASARMSAHPNTSLPCPHPCILPSHKHSKQLDTTTQSPHNRNPQSSLNINSRVALQHVRFQPDKSFHASQVTSCRCSAQGRHAVPASARMSAHANTSLPCPYPCILPPQKHFPHSTPQHKAPTTATLNQA